MGKIDIKKIKTIGQLLKNGDKIAQKLKMGVNWHEKSEKICTRIKNMKKNASVKKLAQKFLI